jgi:lipoate-protein ligase A
VSLLRGTPAELHAREIDWSRRSVTVCEATSTAVVLGSTQPEPPPGGTPTVRRRSGGGAVWVAPGDPMWVDVVVPRDDPQWDDDVGRAFWWLGEAWAEALGGDAEVHRGSLCTTQWSRQVCFAGLGPGEVTMGGRKVVGIAQRRTRHGALFQCAVLRTWDPGPLVARLGLPAEAGAALGDVAIGIADVTNVTRRFSRRVALPERRS